MSWCDLDLTFDLAVVTLTYKIENFNYLNVGTLGKGMTPASQINLHAISANFTEEQQIKIKHRRRYVRKQKASDPCNTSKDDLDLLGDDMEAFSITALHANFTEEQQIKIKHRRRYVRKQKAFSDSQADLEGAADNFLLLHVPNPPLSHQAQVTALQNKIVDWKNPWVINLTSNSSNKWGSFKCPC